MAPLKPISSRGARPPRDLGGPRSRRRALLRTGRRTHRARASTPVRLLCPAAPRVSRDRGRILSHHVRRPLCPRKLPAIQVRPPSPVALLSGGRSRFLNVAALGQPAEASSVFGAIGQPQAQPQAQAVGVASSPPHPRYSAGRSQEDASLVVSIDGSRTRCHGHRL